MTARVGRGTAVTWVSWASARVLTLATLVLLTHTLPAAGLGTLFSALAAGVLGAALAMGGLPDATTRHAAASTEVPFGRGDVRRALVRFAATLPLIAAVLVGIDLSSADHSGAAVVVAGLLLAITQGATTIIASVFRARGEAGRFAFVTTLFISVGRAGVALVALLLGADAAVVLWTFVALNAGLIALTWRSAMRGLPPGASDPEGYGAMQLGGVVWSLMGNLDVVVVGVVLGAADAGTYGASLRIAEVAVQFFVALSVLYLPEATRLVITGRVDALGALYRTTGRWSTVVALLAAGIGFVCAPALGRIIFPDDPSVTTAVLRVLFVGYALHGALGQTYSTLLALGAYRDVRRTSVVTLPLLLVGTVGLTWAFGTVGAAVSTCLAYAFTGTWWAVLVHRRIGGAPFDELYGRALAACAASWAVAVVVWHATAGIGAVASLVATSVFAVIAWLVALPLAGALAPGERLAAQRLRSRFPRPSS